MISLLASSSSGKKELMGKIELIYWRLIMKRLYKKKRREFHNRNLAFDINLKVIDKECLMTRIA